MRIRRDVLVAVSLLIAVACADGTQGSSSSSGAPLTEAELDAYVRGIQREAEAVKSAQQRSTTAKTPQERGEAIQASFEDNTIPLGADAAGLSAERYKEVRTTVHKVLQTLDFQGKIDGPLSIDLSRVSEQQKQELARDAFADLPAASAAAIRSRMDPLVAAWSAYLRLTAVAG